MIVKNMGQGGTWYVTAATFPTAQMARAAWERTDRTLSRKVVEADDGIGVVRIGPHPVRGGVHAVIAVSLDRALIQKAERIIAGESWQPEDGFVEAMIYRRARMVATGIAGRLVIRRPEGRGAQMDRAGRMYEPGQNTEQQ